MQLLAGTDAGTGVGGSCGGVRGDSAVQPHSMGGVVGERGGTHTGTLTGTYTRMLHLPFSDLPLKKCLIGTAIYPLFLFQPNTLYMYVSTCIHIHTPRISPNLSYFGGPSISRQTPAKLLLALICLEQARKIEPINDSLWDGQGQLLGIYKSLSAQFLLLTSED